MANPPHSLNIHSFLIFLHVETYVRTFATSQRREKKMEGGNEEQESDCELGSIEKQHLEFSLIQEMLHTELSNSIK